MENIALLRKEAIGAAGECQKLAEDCGCGESAAVIGKIRRTLKDNKIVIMTIGEARTGKSSLLSSYLEDEDLFPVDVDVTTCVITMVTYGEKEKITVVLCDENGSERAVEIKREQIADFAKEQNNPDGTRRAAMILVETPNEILKDGFVFVDSPGIGSLNPRHSQLTYQFLPRADMVMFVTDATSQMSVSELRFLKSVHEVCKNILFVLTKKDLQYDCDEIISRNKAEVERETGMAGEQQRWIPVSSNLLMAFKRTGMQEFLEESNFAALDSEITKVISERRPQIVILPRLLEIRDELEKISRAIEVEEIACGGDADAIRLKKEKLEELKLSRQELKEKIENLDYRIREKTLSMEDALTAMFEEYASDAAEYIDACLQKKEYANNPDTLKTEIIGMTENSITKVLTYAADTVDGIQYELEKEIGLTFDFASPEMGIGLDRGEKVNFKKNTKMQQIVQTGQKIRKTSYALNAIGGVAGAVVGGVAGFAVGGPGGAVVMATTGADLGKELGGLVGTGKGVVDVIAHGTGYDVEAVRKGLKGYVAGCTKNWNHSKQRFMSDCRTKIKCAILQKIKSDLSEIDDMIKTLTESKKREGLELAKERKLVETLRISCNEQYAALQILINRCAGVIPENNVLTDSRIKE